MDAMYLWSDCLALGVLGICHVAAATRSRIVCETSQDVDAMQVDSTERHRTSRPAIPAGSSARILCGAASALAHSAAVHSSSNRRRLLWLLQVDLLSERQ